MSQNNNNLVFYQCKLTQICQNDRCFWKQRDCYGLNPFPVWKSPEGNFPLVEENEKIVEKYGEPYYPKFKVTVGTNTMYIICEDYCDEN